MSRRYRAAIGPGCVLVLVLLGAHGLATDFGALELVGMSLAGFLLALSRWDRDGHWVPRVSILLVVSAAMLLVLDLALLVAPSSARRPPPLAGLYASDPEIGFRLAPNVSLVYRDAVVPHARYTTNALGHRDAMPVGEGENRVLLLGDSMTFGELLDDEETIDRAIESLSNQRFDAYNLSVPGYGAEASAATLARNELPARAAVYLFYENDLRNDGLATQRNRLWRGYLVPREDASGETFSEAELDARLNRVLARPDPWLDLIRLRHLMRAIDRARRSPLVRGFEELSTDRPGPMGYRDDNVAVVVQHTRQMRELAQQRGLDFAVVILPSLAEATFERRYALVETYATAIRRHGIEVLGEVTRYAASDYFAHNGHFDPSGATKTAKVIVDWLDRSALE